MVKKKPFRLLTLPQRRKRHAEDVKKWRKKKKDQGLVLRIVRGHYKYVPRKSTQGRV